MVYDMTDFKTFLNDFSHLVSGMSSVAGGMKSEVENNIHSVFNNFAMQAGFVRRDEFENLSDRFEQALEKINTLEAIIDKTTQTAKD
jgi:BMFP domain-containing protein YqiC